MVKHWPGGGCGEAGRDAHFGCGKFGVYPGNNLEYQLKPFVEGAFHLNEKTGKASAVMPYYMAPFEQDPVHGESVGSSYSEYLIKDMLREHFGYDEIVCTDWNIIQDETEPDSLVSGKCWGVEKLTVPERCLKIILAGVDQFGGLTESDPSVESQVQIIYTQSIFSGKCRVDWESNPRWLEISRWVRANQTELSGD